MTLISPKQLVVLSAIILLAVTSNLFFSFTGSDKNATPLTGPEACRSCHKAITDSFMETAHYFDSRPADINSIKGSFTEGENRYKYNQFMEEIMYKDE